MTQILVANAAAVCPCRKAAAGLILGILALALVPVVRPWGTRDFLACRVETGGMAGVRVVERRKVHLDEGSSCWEALNLDPGIR